MATKLINPVKRELLATQRGQTMIVEIEPGDTITFRVKGKRTRYTVSLHKVYNLALMQFLLENYKVKLEAYKINKKYGHKRLRKPKPPNMSMFSKEYLISLK